MEKQLESVQINDLIFRELIKRGYSLEGNTRVWNIADSKLWYLKPEQAQAYLEVLDSTEYKRDFNPQEYVLVDEHLDLIMKQAGGQPINIIDLGCGDGRKAIRLIKAFAQKTKLRYCPVDISAYMVRKAIENITSLNMGEVVKSQWNISDFDNLENVTNLIQNSEYPKSLYLLMGNTLSNFEFHDLLYQIRSSMKTGDVLMIGNGVEDNEMEEELLKFFENKDWDNFFFKILSQLGFRKEGVKLRARFKNSRLEFYYEIKQEHQVSFANKEVRFQKGDQIIVCISYHYTKQDFQSFLHLYFDEVNVKFSKNGRYALALCKK